VSQLFDVLVIGAGPGGLVAAVTAAEEGMRVCLVDDNSSAGGQIWRAGVDSANPGAEEWLCRFERAHVETRFGCRAVFAPAARVLRIEQAGQFDDIAYASLILATGARELFLPFPGWTLPGIFGAGGLQAFVKSGLDIRGKRVVIAGTGPLLLAVGAHLRAAGAQIAAIVEQAPLRQLAPFALGLARGHVGKLVEGAGYALATAGIPYRTGAWVMSAFGDRRLERVTIRSGSRIFEIAAEMLAMGYHLVPNTEVAQLLHCELEAGYVRVDEMQQTSEKGIYCVGELTGIGGVDKAKVEGRIAALAAAGQLSAARAFFKQRDRHVRFACRLAAAFALREELRTLPAESTLVCRCEDVPYAAVAHCRSWREAKLHTRCGMGPCQGRICGPAMVFLFGWPAPAPRPPVFPVEMATLGQSEDAGHETAPPLHSPGKG
jgi:NADPH-dependent 2,4-dienoyl-CoA reductase/sulfur reductase-like enzyme